MKNRKFKNLSELLCSIFGHKISIRVGKITRREECIRCSKVWVFENAPLYGIGSKMERDNLLNENLHQEVYPLQQVWDRIGIDDGITYLHGDREKAATELYEKLSELGLVKPKKL